MPLQPIRFTTPKDVYNFLEKVLKFQRTRGLSKESILSELTKLMVVATDQQTYFLPDIFAMSTAEVSASRLSFAKKTDLSSYIFLADGHDKLCNENSSLIHNKALAEAVLNLDLNPYGCLDYKSMECHDMFTPKKEVGIPYIDAKTEESLDCTEVIEKIFSQENTAFAELDAKTNQAWHVHNDNYEGRVTQFHAQTYAHFVERYMLNLALIDLQIVTRMQVHNYLLEMAKTNPESRVSASNMIERKNQQISLYKLSLEDLFAVYSDYSGGMDTKSLLEFIERNKNLFIVKDCSLNDVKYKYDHSKHSRKVYLRLMIPVLLIPICLPLIGIASHSISKAKKDLVPLQVEVDQLKKTLAETFLRDQRSKLSTQVVEPCLLLLKVMQDTLLVETPAEKVTQQNFPSKLSSLLSNTILPGPPSMSNLAEHISDRALPTKRNSL